MIRATVALLLPNTAASFKLRSTEGSGTVADGRFGFVSAGFKAIQMMTPAAIRAPIDARRSMAPLNLANIPEVRLTSDAVTCAVCVVHSYLLVADLSLLVDVRITRNSFGSALLSTSGRTIAHLVVAPHLGIPHSRPGLGRGVAFPRSAGVRRQA